ncbi:hypothetical protein GF389_05840 [Candidatus Dojkabacteria bacterium]|nr:hypothetical protein [Candidatus Dojkabacteria bacterium]
MSNLKRYRVLVIVIGTIILFLIVLLALSVTDKEDVEQTWIEREEQNPELVEDVKLALPYSDVDFSIFYSEEDDLFSVSYPGYKTIDEIEVKAVSWFRQFYNSGEISVKYGGIGGDLRKYDMSQPNEILLKDNSYIRYLEEGEYGVST